MSAEFTALIAGLTLTGMGLFMRSFVRGRRRIRELQDRVFEAEQALKQRGVLANEIAHEIKNPITAILCSAETLDLLIGKDIAEEHRISLRYIREYGDNLLRLVSDFIDVSRAESGNIQAKPEKTRVVPLIDSIIGLLESNAQRKHIVVKNLSTDPDLKAFVDAKHLRQVVFNLLHNAIKFTGDGGEIQIVSKDEFPNRSITIAVKDNGCGMSREELEHVFCPYACAGGYHRDTGTGLGLALCKSLIELANGSISVDSQQGVGTSFEVTIPAWRENSAPTISQSIALPAENSQPLSGQRFLLVDEDAGSRHSVAGLIKAWGGMVTEASLAVEAVEALEDCDYDAIMIDDTQDGVDAPELARILRQHMQLKDTTIIIASKLECDQSAFKESLADRWVEKPLNGRTILDSLMKSGKLSITH